MNIVIFILLFLIFSCSYPDIDSVPKFNNLNKTIYEKCSIFELYENNEDNCEFYSIIKRL
mgnify:CR=1 FL=1